MHFFEAMRIINEFGAKAKSPSLFDAMIEMEENMSYLKPEQKEAWSVIVGGWEDENVA
jgi:hypothetical protein